ncbi:MAG TPA: hypothetical protein VHA06_17065 [Candidatus Angelobacter sp.]|nr:hypothetical protein [Candidatus Angelobacter sp.]
MSRKILLAAALTVFAASGLAQTTNQTPAAPANGQPFGGPILVTPNATLTSPPPTAGISDAGRAGISVNSNAAAMNGTTPAATTDMTGNESIAVSPALSTETPAENTPTNDLGVSVSVNDASATAAPIGVAEAASQYKTEKTTVNARTLDNQDVQQILSGKESVITASNISPQGADRQPLSAGIQTGSGQSAQPSAQNNAVPQSTSPVQSSGTETSTDNATTPQINQNQQSNDAQGTTTLPATATILPLLGLLGLASAGFGLWFFKFRFFKFRKSTSSQLY